LAVGGAEAARSFAAEVVVGLGGGSPMDLAKAVAALASNPGDPLDYLEVVGRGRPLSHTPLPCVAVPTTAGTGAEVTRNAVLSVPEARVKVSLRSPLMLPRVALVDPTLTWGCPADQTAYSGLDALTQLIEAFVCNQPNPLTDAFCRDGIARAARSLRAACHDEPAARSDMALAGLLGGLALANAKLGAVHGLAGPLGGRLGAPHGALCAALLPAVFAENAKAAGGPRFDEVGRLLTGSATAGATEALAFLESLVGDLNVPPLAHWGLTPKDHASVLPAARQAGSMQGNPVVLSDEALTSILSRS
jgi:alcohol dehydrogenase class IV